MPSEILAPGKTVGVSSDVAIAAGSTGTVALYTALNDHLELPQANGGGAFLLPDGVSTLLLPNQVGGDIPHTLRFPINLKDPLGSYQPSGLQLRSTEPFKELGPGTWQVARPVTTVAIGVQKDA